MTALAWRRTGPYTQEAEADGHGYAIAKTLNGNGRPAQYLAWYGPALTAMPLGYFPLLLGVRDTAAQAQSLCLSHITGQQSNDAEEQAHTETRRHGEDKDDDPQGRGSPGERHEPGRDGVLLRVSVPSCENSLG